MGGGVEWDETLAPSLRRRQNFFMGIARNPLKSPDSEK